MSALWQSMHSASVLGYEEPSASLIKCRVILQQHQLGDQLAELCSEHSKVRAGGTNGRTKQYRQLVLQRACSENGYLQT